MSLFPRRKKCVKPLRRCFIHLGGSFEETMRRSGRGRRLEVEGSRSKARGRRLEVGGSRSEVRGRRLEVGGSRSDALGRTL